MYNVNDRGITIKSGGSVVFSYAPCGILGILLLRVGNKKWLFKADEVFTG